MSDLKRIGLEPEQVKALTRLKPLDRGKVLELLDSELLRIDKIPRDVMSIHHKMGRQLLTGIIKREINSGRLDVEEG